MVKQNPMTNIGLKTPRYLCCQSLYHSLSLAVIRCTTRCHSLSLVVICCHSSYHSLSFVVTLCTSRCHSLSFVVTRCTTRLSFYKRSDFILKILFKFFLKSDFSFPMSIVNSFRRSHQKKNTFFLQKDVLRNFVS